MISWIVIKIGKLVSWCAQQFKDEVEKYNELFDTKNKFKD